VADGLTSGGTLLLPGIEGLHRVGSGGSATLYRGRQSSFHRDVAVKVLHAGVEGPGVSRFAKELRAIGSLSGHPHVVPLYDAGEVDGHPYMVMPFMSGGSLADRLRSGPVPPGEAARIGIAVAEVLVEAHRIGILHRDIKPANVLFDSYGQPQLADFGIARFSDSTLTQGLVAATIAYAAPEILAGQPASPAADIYSLGATLYAALSGRPAFAGRPEEAPIAFALRVMHSDPDPLHGVPAGLATLVAKAMDKEPGRRFASAAEMAEVLARSCSAEVAARPEGAPAAATSVAAPVLPGGRTPRSRERPAVLPASTRTRRRLPLLAAFVVLLVAGVSVAVSVGSSGHGRPRRAVSVRSAATSVPGAIPASGPAPGPTTSVAHDRPASTSPPTSSPVSSVAQSGAPATLSSYVRAYYGLVNDHSLSEAWTWLSSSYQQQLGYAYYQHFWDSVSSVTVLDVVPGTGEAAVTLRYQMASGATETDRAVLSFITAGPTGRRLIASTTVVG
jgi:serine/threonine protein kinase